VKRGSLRNFDRVGESEKVVQEPGLRERMTSPVSGSLRMKTHGEKRKSEGKRTA